MDSSTFLTLGLSVVVIIIFIKTLRIVPQRSAFIVERLGKYNKTLEAGFHVLIPVFDSVSYKQNQMVGKLSRYIQKHQIKYLMRVFYICLRCQSSF